MAFLSFESVGEFMLFLTSFVAGMTIIMGENAINATPKFMYDYYKYIKKDENAKPGIPEFWAKIITYYFLMTFGTQMFLQPLNLTPFFRRLSLLFRLESGALLMLVEILIVCLMPHTTSSEAGAVAGMVLAAFIGGVSRALFENAVFGLFGPCHPKMVIAAMVGLPASGVIMSILQIILLATMKPEFKPILTESIIYFCVALFIVLISAVLLALLAFNPFAKRYIAEFRSDKSFWQSIYTPPKKLHCSSPESAHEHGAQASPFGLAVPETKEHELSTEKDQGDVGHGSTAEMLQGVSLIPLLKKIYPMLIVCFLSFFITCLLFPGVLIQVDKTDAWYITLVIATFNITDLIGRLPSLHKRLQISRKLVLIMSFPRLAFIPLLMLCAKHIITGKTAPYILTALMGLSGGYIGSMVMMSVVSLPELETDGERSMAGQICNMVLLFSVATGAFIQIFCLSSD